MKKQKCVEGKNIENQSRKGLGAGVGGVNEFRWGRGQLGVGEEKEREYNISTGHQLTPGYRNTMPRTFCVSTPR